MLLSMAEKIVYYRYVEKHSHRLGHLEESRMDMTRLRGRGREIGEGEVPCIALKKPQGVKRVGHQNIWII